jgi:pimeloyl-ACP methyl ester carboxylesterase
MDLDQELAAYQAAHPPKTLAHRGVTWRYTRAGSGPVIVVLTGALGIAEAGFRVLTRLEERFTVIAPDYPDITDPTLLLDGLIAIADRENVRRAVWSGGSFGGLIAQRLAERAPDRFAGMVLSHTGLVTAARSPGWGLFLVEALPARWIAALIRRRLRALLAGVPDFWYRWFDRTISGFGRDQLVRRVRLADGLSRLPAGTPWTGPTLIIESDNDPAVRPAQRAALRAAYPQARLHRFTGTGHAASVLDPEGTVRMLSEFDLSIQA